MAESTEAVKSEAKWQGGKGATGFLASLPLCLLASLALPPARQQAPPPPPPAAWRGLIGEYGTPDSTQMMILERDGRFIGRFGAVNPVEIVFAPAGTDAFLSTGDHPGERIGFRRARNGRATAIVQGNIRVARRSLGPEDGAVFRITPVRPLDQLRREALGATPPAESGSFRPADLVELVGLDSTIKLDIRYASDRNFLGRPVYSQARAFLQRPAAEALRRAHQALRRQGLGLLIHDGYRPWYVTRMFWDATPPAQHEFVADPATGSRHNRGAAVDLSLYELRSGRVVEMPGSYDEFSHRSYPDYPGGTSRQRWYRDTLRRAMEAEGFTVYSVEWWHFDYQDWKEYPLGNVTFETIK